jgi:hypothetical protein
VSAGLFVGGVVLMKGLVLFFMFGEILGGRSVGLLRFTFNHYMDL